MKWKKYAKSKSGFLFMVIPYEGQDNRMNIDFETTIFQEGGYDYNPFLECWTVWGQYTDSSHAAFPIDCIKKIGTLNKNKK